jgi:ABC-type nitrate/sulfonate/bicarbonate transport system permease component
VRAGRWQRWWLGVAGLGGFLVLLEVAPRAGLVPERYLPPTSRIAGALADELGQPSFWTALGDTLEGWAIGLAVAVAAAVGLGLLIGSVPALRAAAASTIEFLRPIPSVALIPLAVLLFGTDLRSKLLLVVYASFWQVLVQVLSGTQDVDPVAMDTARSYRLGRWARIRHVVSPTTLPMPSPASGWPPRSRWCWPSPPSSSSAARGWARRSRSPRPAGPSRRCTPWSWWPACSGSGST